jgi:hypothetical protein
MWPRAQGCDKDTYSLHVQTIVSIGVDSSATAWEARKFAIGDRLDELLCCLRVLAHGLEWWIFWEGCRL